MGGGGRDGAGGGPSGTGGIVAMGGGPGSGAGGVVGSGGMIGSGGATGTGGRSGSCSVKIPATCAELDSAYDTELKAQLMCGTLGLTQCGKLVTSTIGCDCVKGFVVDDACLAPMQKKYLDMGCPSTCTRTLPAQTCMTAKSAKCMTSLSSLQGMCVSSY